MTRLPAERTAWAVGGIGLVGTTVCLIVSPSTFPHAWLAALTVWLGWPLGCMGLLLIHSLTGGRWGEALQPQLIAGMITLPLLLPALVPLLIVLPSLYPWARPGASQLGNHFYLNVPFFAGRGVVYLIVWFGLGGFILRALRRPAPDRGLSRLAPAGLILLALTVTFAAIDTTMSLNPDFASSDYGLIAMSETGLLALAVSLLAAAWRPPPIAQVTSSLGQLLLALVILWAYLDFMQVLIVWQSDLATDAPWYVVRSRGIWADIAVAVAVGHFALPFFVLLRPQLRASLRSIATVAGLLIVSAILDGWWLVVPASGHGLDVTDAFAMLGVIGIAAAVALRSPLLPAMPEALQRHV